MKDGQLFRVKVIKNESDLPKKEGVYIAEIHKEVSQHKIMLHLPLETNANYQTWKYHCTWYLEEYTPKSTLENKDFFEQKIKDEITNKDIESWAETEPQCDIEGFYSVRDDEMYKEGLRKGAVAMRDDLIKHKK